MADAIDFRDEEDALSLSDLPINTDDPDIEEFPPKLKDRRSSSEPADFFEFFSDISSEMSHAEDIIFCGKLVPLKEHQQLFPNQTRKPARDDDDDRIRILQSFHRKRSESLSDLMTRPNIAHRTKLMRNSRSLDYKKLGTNSSMSSEPSEIRRNSSQRSLKSDFSGSKASKRRWYVLMFGLMKFPPEMDLRDIRSRQVRNNPSTFFPLSEAGKRVSAGRSERKSSWGILRALSCKDHASVAVMASSGCMPPARDIS